MEFEVGAILDGKVTGMTKFGAFVSLEGGKSGMVHISEVASTFVKEITDFVKENQEVRVKVISIDQNGRIALSMKQAIEPIKREEWVAPKKARVPAVLDWTNQKAEEISFEDRLNKFKQDSDQRMWDLKRTIEGKRGGSGGRRGGGKNNF